MVMEKKVFTFSANGREQSVDLGALMNPPDLTDPDYHKMLSHHYACVSELRGAARMEWEEAKLRTDGEFNRLWLWFTEHYEEKAKRPTREHLRACVETQESWMEFRRADMAAERNYRDACSICDALWYHNKLVMAVTAGVAECIAEEIRYRGGK